MIAVKSGGFGCRGREAEEGGWMIGEGWRWGGGGWRGWWRGEGERIGVRERRVDSMRGRMVETGEEEGMEERMGRGREGIGEGGGRGEEEMGIGRW